MISTVSRKGEAGPQDGERGSGGVTGRVGPAANGSLFPEVLAGFVAYSGSLSAHSSTWIYVLYLAFKLSRNLASSPVPSRRLVFRSSARSTGRRKAVEGWPSTDASIQWCKVHTEGSRSFWVEVTYSYFVGEYPSGTLYAISARTDAADFVRELKDRHIQILQGVGPGKLRHPRSRPGVYRVAGAAVAVRGSNFPCPRVWIYAWAGRNGRLRTLGSELQPQLPGSGDLFSK